MLWNTTSSGLTMKITFNIPDHLIRDFFLSLQDKFINAIYNYKKNLKIRDDIKLNGIINSWVNYFIKNEHEDLIMTLKTRAVKHGLFAYNIYHSERIVGTVSKVPYMSKYFNYNINLIDATYTIFDKMSVNITTSGVMTIKASDNKVICGKFIGYEYNRSEDTLILFTETGNNKFAIRRYDVVITYILSLLNSVLENNNGTK